MLAAPPDDILIHICHHMNQVSLASMALVCSRWNRILWKSLHRLEIHNTPKIDKSLIRIVAERSQKLNSLTISKTGLLDENTVEALLEMAELRSLTLDRCKQFSTTALTLLESHSALRELNLMSFESFSIFRLPSSLTSFSLRNIESGTSPMPLLSTLSNLQTLQISDVNSYIANPRSAGFPPNLTCLELRNAHVSNLTMPAITLLTRLEHLNLQGNRNLESNAVLKLTTLTKLKSLELDYTGVTNSAIHKLCRSLVLLENFSAVGTGWRGDSLECLTSMRKLKTLSVSGHYIGSAFLVSLMKHGSIAHLGLRDSIFSPSDIRLLKMLTTLRSLDLSYIFFPNDRLLHIKDLKFLSALNLYKNFEITSAGIAELKSLPCLAQFNIGMCPKVEDDIGQALAPFPALTDLNLRDNNITDASLEALLALPRILDLNLSNCTYVKSRQTVSQNPPRRGDVRINVIVEED